MDFKKIYKDCVLETHETLQFCFFFLPVSGFISNLTIQRQYFPNDEDQVGAAKALLRLQDTYNLDTDTISKGNLPGKIILAVCKIPWLLSSKLSPLGQCVV